MTQPSWIGQTLGGRYVIEDELGHGGMATVFKATDTNLSRVVAIKLIHAHLSSSPEFVRRFEAEAMAVAQLRHPNIIQVFDFNHDNDIYYIAFEFVAGDTLQSQLKQLNEAGRQMEMADVFKIGTSIGNALQYAHARDIIHRDVKPANVMLNVQGDAILADFGIVKMMGGTQHTATGAVMGTARYMSPEQIRGQKIDARSDIYSYGTMLYEMVSGHSPFNAESVMTLMMMHVNDPIPDVRHIRSGVSPNLVAVINKAMAKEPNQRYQTMAELLSDLSLAQASKSVPLAGTGVGSTLVESDLADLLTPEPASTEYSSQKHEPLQPAQPSSKMDVAPKQNRTMTWGLGVLLIAALLVAGFFIFRPSPFEDVGDGATTATSVDNVIVVETMTPDAVASLQESPTSIPSTATLMPTATEPTATEQPPTATQLPPTVTNAPSIATSSPPTATNLPPTATSPPPTSPPPTSPPPTEITQLSAQITGIILEGDHYSVSYDTIGYTEGLPGQHVHFFFNNVPQDQAGIPGSGPWIVYGGPRPFTGYGLADRPQSATQMCILVANSDHTINVNSGNCVNLP